MRSHLPFLILALGSLAVSVTAQTTTPTWTGWRLYAENDTFAWTRETTDRHYTHGTRVALRRSQPETWSLSKRTFDLCPTFLCPAKPEIRRDEVVSTFVIGQNQYTPKDITSFLPDPEDRPFAGYLYAGVNTTIGAEIQAEALWSAVKIIPETTIEMDLGVLGSPSLAGSAQATVHVLRESRIPRGWHAQIGPEPTAQLLYANRVGLRLHPLAHPVLPQLEVTPSVRGALGTVQVFGAAGVTLRAGWNLTGLATNIIPIAYDLGAPHSWGLSASFGWERRWWARNAFLDGGILGEPPSADRQPHNTDVRWSVELRVDPFTMTYTDVERTQELASGPFSGPDHRFGSLALAYTAGTTSKVGRWLALGLEHLVLDAGMGVGVSSDGTLARGGRAMRVAAGLDFGRWGVSFVDMSGVVDEARGPEADGTHQDDFYITKGFSAWVAPLLHLKIGRPLLRVGMGRPLVKHQTMRGEEIEDEEVIQDGWRPFLGIGLEIPLGASKEVQLGIETTWSPVSLSDRRGDGPQGEFLTTLVGLKWRPRFPAAHHDEP